MSPTVSGTRRHLSASRPPDRRRALGRLGEEIAAAHLERLGFTIVDRNHRTRFGEIDLIASNGRVLAFVEVKTRRAGSPAIMPLDGLSVGQRRRLRRLAAAWIQSHRLPAHPSEIRFDAIGVVVDRSDRLLRLDHLEGAW